MPSEFPFGRRANDKVSLEMSPHLRWLATDGNAAHASQTTQIRKPISPKNQKLDSVASPDDSMRFTFLHGARHVGSALRNCRSGAAICNEPVVEARGSASDDPFNLDLAVLPCLGTVTAAVFISAPTGIPPASSLVRSRNSITVGLPRQTTTSVGKRLADDAASGAASSSRQGARHE
jgi:hypothetical protein